MRILSESRLRLKRLSSVKSTHTHWLSVLSCVPGITKNGSVKQALMVDLQINHWSLCNFQAVVKCYIGHVEIRCICFAISPAACHQSLLACRISYHSFAALVARWRLLLNVRTLLFEMLSKLVSWREQSRTPWQSHFDLLQTSQWCKISGKIISYYQIVYRIACWTYHKEAATWRPSFKPIYLVQYVSQKCWAFIASVFYTFL